MRKKLPPRRPPQFGLKTLFKLVLLASLWLGIASALSMIFAQLIGWTILVSVFGLMYFGISHGIHRRNQRGASSLEYNSGRDYGAESAAHIIPNV